MIGFPNPQQQAWWQAIQQQQARYQQQIGQALDLATYHQALTMPRQYGYGAMANPLLAQASNTGTALLQPTHPPRETDSGTTLSVSPELMRYMLGQGGA